MYTSSKTLKIFLFIAVCYIARTTTYYRSVNYCALVTRSWCRMYTATRCHQLARDLCRNFNSHILACRKTAAATCRIFVHPKCLRTHFYDCRGNHSTTTTAAATTTTTATAAATRPPVISPTTSPPPPDPTPSTCPGKQIYHSSGYDCSEILTEPMDTAEELRALWPGYFLNEAEIRDLVDASRCRSTSVSMTAWENVTVTNDGLNTKRRRRSASRRTARSAYATRNAERVAGPFYHACCESYAEFRYPNSAWNLNNKRVNIVQMKGAWQRVFTETCKRSPGCSACTCTQPHPFEYQVVVDKGNRKLTIDWITIGGSCKCLNIAP